MRVGIYDRISTQEQQTLPLQIKDLREYAKNRKWKTEGCRFRRENAFMFEVCVEKTQTIQLPALINSVLGGEEVIFTQSNLPVAKLIAVHQEKRRPQFGSAKRLFLIVPYRFNSP